MHEHDAKSNRHRDSHELQWLDRTNKQESAEERRREIVDVPRRQSLFGDERRGEQRFARERVAEHRVRGECAGDRRCGASALAAREWQPLFDNQ